MAFVASNDLHGNEIMRVMLSAEPGKRTVASCHNLRINCSPMQSNICPERFGKPQQFYFYADASLASKEQKCRKRRDNPDEPQLKQRSQLVTDEELDNLEKQEKQEKKLPLNEIDEEKGLKQLFNKEVIKEIIQRQSSQKEPYFFIQRERPPRPKLSQQKKKLKPNEMPEQMLESAQKQSLEQLKPLEQQNVQPLPKPSLELLQEQVLEPLQELSKELSQVQPLEQPLEGFQDSCQEDCQEQSLTWLHEQYVKEQRQQQESSHVLSIDKLSISTTKTAALSINGKDSIKSSPHFESWLAGKKEERHQLAEHRRQQALMEDKRAEERARLAQLKYQRWMDSKAEIQRGKSDLSATQTPTGSQPSLNTDEAQRRLLHWEREKVAELKAQREEREAREARQEKIDNTRRELSAEAWEQWVETSRCKPRPVPMGQGLDSLRGTNAPQFINPNQWQSVLPADPKNVPQTQRQPQPTSSTQQRVKPNYDRIQRLAQPRNKFWRTSFADPTQSIPKKATNGASGPMRAVPKGNAREGQHKSMTSLSTSQPNRNENVSKKCAPEGNNNNGKPIARVTPEEIKIANENCNQLKVEMHAYIKSNLPDCSKDLLNDTTKLDKNPTPNKDVKDGFCLRKCTAHIMWSKWNVQRINEMRQANKSPEPNTLHDDQLELLRKQQELQKRKILPKRFQLKRDQLRQKLKDWVERGKLNDYCTQLTNLATERLANNLKANPKFTPRNVYMGENPNAKEVDGKQRSDDRPKLNREKSGSPEERPKVVEPKKVFKPKEFKEPQKSKPWR